MDNTLLLAIGTCLTYVVLNFSASDILVIPNSCMYPLVTFTMVGNYRVMLVYSDWQRWKAIIYKIIKLYGATYFSVYGVYITYNNLSENPDYFLLFIFSTVDFYV